MSEPVQGDWPTAGTGVPVAFTALDGLVRSYLVLVLLPANPTEAPSDPAEAVLEPGGVPHRCVRLAGAGLGGHLRR